MKVQIDVIIDEFYYRNMTSTIVPDAFVSGFKPLNLSDDPLMCCVTGDKMIKSLEVERVIKFRKNVAKHLSAAITESLMKAMGSKDTLNGYKVVREEDHGW